MVDESYGFLSGAGEAFARRIVGGIVADVSADAGRRRALDRVSDALEQISDRDGAHPEQVTLDALAARLSEPFAKAGFLPPSGTEIRAHWDDWSRRGVPAGPLSSCPDGASRAGAFAAAASAAAARLAGIPGVAVASARVTPWDDGFCDEQGNPPGAIVVFPWRGDFSGVALMGVALLGPSGASYLDEMRGDIADHLAGGVFEMPEGADAASLACALGALRDAVAGFNEASSYVADPARLGFGLAEGAVPVLTATWDGEAIQDAAKIRNPGDRAPHPRPQPARQPRSSALREDARRPAEAGAWEAFDQISFDPAPAGAVPPGMR